MSNVVLIAAIEARSAVQAIPDASIEDRARAAMRAVQNHWMATREEDQFLAACEGLAQTATPEEFERIKDDLERQSKAGAVLQALAAGVPVDFDALDVPEPAENHLGLRKLWEEVARA